MISRGLLISLGITLLASVILFLYFKKRLAVVEHKLNMMFQLIEEHNAQQNVTFTPHLSQNVVRPPPVQPQLSPVKENELIQVSDDDSQSSDSGTDSESDSDESEDSNDSNRININDESANNIQAAEIKHIDLSLTKDDNINDGLDDLESLSDVEPLNIETLINKKTEDSSNYENLMNKIEMAKEQENKPDLNTLKVPELKKLASAAGVPKYKSMRKNQLIQALSEN